jgi:hypothetical protein
MKDSAGLDDHEEIVATLEWAAGALLRAALHDSEPPPALLRRYGLLISCGQRGNWPSPDPGVNAMRIRFLAAAGLVLTAMSVTACSGGSSPGSATSGSATSGSGSGGSAAGTSQAGPASSSSINVCSLMTAKRASSIVGVTYSKATPATNMCTYLTTDAPIGMYIIIFPDSGGTAAWKEQLATMEEDGGGPPVSISGFSGQAASDGTEISVQAGSDIIDVHGGDPSGTGSTFPRSIAIAKAIVSQLH